MKKRKYKKSKQAKKENVKSILFIISILLIFLVVVDYFNLLNMININVNKLNIDIWNILINSAITIVLYYITYMLINKKIVEQNKNKKSISNLLLKNTYNSCLEQIEFISNYKGTITSKIDYDKDLKENKIYINLIESPFENNDMILSFAKEGIIADNQLNDYITIKETFRKYINLVIVYYDNEEYGIRYKEILEENIKDTIKKIEK